MTRGGLKFLWVQKCCERLGTNLAQITTVADSGAGQATGTRIGKILDQVDFPASMRTISTGQSNCIADPGTLRTSLNAVKNAEFSEQGAFFINGSGTAVFKSRNEVASSISGTPIEFNQTGGIPYRNLIFAFDDKLIINQAQMTRVGGTAQFYENADSIARYFPHQYSAQDLVIDTDANALNIAATYVATRAETTIRIDQMVIDLLDPAVPTDTIIGLDYFDNLRISNNQPDGSTIVKTLQCQGLSWLGLPSSYETKSWTMQSNMDDAELQAIVTQDLTDAISYVDSDLSPTLNSTSALSATDGLGAGGGVSFLGSSLL